MINKKSTLKTANAKLEKLGFVAVDHNIYRKQTVIWSGGAFRVFDNVENAIAGAELDRRINANETSDDEPKEYAGYLMTIDAQENLLILLDSMSIITTAQ